MVTVSTKCDYCNKEVHGFYLTVQVCGKWTLEEVCQTVHRTPQFKGPVDFCNSECLGKWLLSHHYLKGVECP